MLGADPTKVSMRAKKRGLPQARAPLPPPRRAGPGRRPTPAALQPAPRQGSAPLPLFTGA